MKSQIVIIAAMAENRVIGKNNTLPWSLPEDLKHFKNMTKGFPCIMGRKTWESLPKKPLPGRLNIVVSAAMPGGQHEGFIVEKTLEQAIERAAAGTCAVNDAAETGAAKIFICGGASIYRAALSIADAIELTLVHARYEGDAFFPDIDNKLWQEVTREDGSASNGGGTPNRRGAPNKCVGFSFIRYERKS